MTGRPASPRRSSLFRTAAFATLLALGLAGVHPAGAQNLIIYPSNGQDLEQQAKDENECQIWSQQQSGISPSTAAPVVAQPQGGGAVGGAARGAAVGVVGGAIAGDAGKGAAIGAGVGGTMGLLGSSRKRREAADVQEQATANYNAQMANYNRAFGACMSGRGYTVN